MSSPVLQLENVTKTYSGSPPVHALRGIDLTVKKGELTAICGPSGSGKSTLLNIIGTLDTPTTGSVRIGGHPTAHMADRNLTALRASQIGFVFQSFHLIGGMTAAENVAMGLAYRRIPSHERRERSEEVLHQVGLGHRVNHHPSRLSGGERQRIAIARALAGRPSLVLADEPTGNLDQRTGLEIVRLLRKLNASGTTIIVITHDEALAKSFPRQLRVLDGRLHQTEPHPNQP